MKLTKGLKIMIFISHRTTDKDIADMLVDFLCGAGISKEYIFCSSLPGNDVGEQISSEIKVALHNSTIGVVILSGDYYESAYCLNEAGILWYCDNIEVIPIGLPEINPGNMKGFLSNDYKLRRLDSDDDIAYIYDTISSAVSATHTKLGIVTNETQKLKKRYSDFLSKREAGTSTYATASTNSTKFTTDDERIVLYYILKNNVRIVSKQNISGWLQKSEIYNVNIDNAFDLLSFLPGSKLEGDTFELGIKMFRDYSENADRILSELQSCVDQHTKLAVNVFKELWKTNALNSAEILFVAYIIDERVQMFGDRWKSDSQKEKIRSWEEKKALKPTLSESYNSCLALFTQNDLVYESGWTNYGNANEYTLQKSLQAYLFSNPLELNEKIQIIEDFEYNGIPF